MKSPFMLILAATVSLFSFYSPYSPDFTARAELTAARPENRAAKGDIAKPGGARRLRNEQTAALKASLSDKPAKNVILFIGDGMGDSEITAARNYAKGAGGYFMGIDTLPLTGQYTHYSLDKKTGKPDYVIDSAASATAWAIGVKSYNGAVGVDINGQPHPNLLELAKKAGLATGNVTTAEIEDATPAALATHITHRKCYGPEETRRKCPQNAVENGGRGSIAEQILLGRADVTLGGGAASFAQKATGGKWQGKSLKEQALALGYQWVTNAEALRNVQIANQEKPLIGLFAERNLPTRWTGPQATYHGNLETKAADGTLIPRQLVKCINNPQHSAAIPHLAAMTEKAIQLLQANPKGFFLQIEAASIDKADHEANPCRQIGETVDLDEAVQQALDFARKDGNTLVILTADHAHSSQIIENDAEAPGLTQTLLTADNAPMTLNYGNSEKRFQGHTGTQLRIAAFGPQAANIAGLTDQTDLFYIIGDALRLLNKE